MRVMNDKNTVAYYYKKSVMLVKCFIEHNLGCLSADYFPLKKKLFFLAKRKK